MAKERLVERAGDLDRAMEEVGFPLALKIQSAELPHKSEVGGVKLAVADVQSGREAYRSLIESAKAQRPDAAIQGHKAPMIPTPVGRQRSCPSE